MFSTECRPFFKPLCAEQNCWIRFQFDNQSVCLLLQFSRDQLAELDRISGRVFGEILIEIRVFSFKKMRLKISSVKMAAIFSRERWVNTGDVPVYLGSVTSPCSTHAAPMVLWRRSPGRRRDSWIYRKSGYYPKKKHAHTKYIWIVTLHARNSILIITGTEMSCWGNHGYWLYRKLPFWQLLCSQWWEFRPTDNISVSLISDGIHIQHKYEIVATCLVGL